jgi:hypothetical protein
MGNHLHLACRVGGHESPTVQSQVTLMKAWADMDHDGKVRLENMNDEARHFLPLPYLIKSSTYLIKANLTYCTLLRDSI